MKRKATILALVLTFVLSFGSLSVFAAQGAPTEVTTKAIKDAKVQSILTVTDEVTAEQFAKDLCDQTQKGKYKLVLNSDEERFGGNGAVLPAEIKSKNFECDGKDHMILFDLPPFGAAVYGFSYV